MREGAATLTPEGIIHYCNGRFAEMLKVPLERVMGGRLEDFVAPGDRALLAGMLSEGGGRAELDLTAADATEVPALVSAISLRAEGPAAICLIVSDLTDRKRHEAKIQQLNEELEERIIQRTVELSATNRELKAEVDERKRAEELLRESEARFRSALDDSRDVIYRLNLQSGRYEYISPSAEAVVGFSPTELMLQNTETSLAMVHPDDRPAMQAAVARLEETGKAELEYRQRTRSGSYRWLSNYMSLTRDGAGRPLYRNGSIRDITEHKHAEQALRESEQLYRAIGESIDYGIWVCDPEGRNIYASDSFLNLVGITQQQCSEFGWGDVLHPDDAEYTIAAWKECVRTGGTWDIEHRFRGVDGQWHPVLARGVPVRDEQGQIKYWAGINLNITALKRAEEALRQSEQQFRTLADSIPNLAWWANGNGYITWYNRRWYEYTGTTHEQMEGWGWQSVHDPNELPRVLERWRASLATGEPFDMIFPLRGADGVFRPFLTRVMPLKDEEGRVTRWFGTNTDVSEQKRVEEALRKSEQEFRALAEAVPQIVWATRPDGWNIYFNQQWMDYTGLTLDESYGHGWITPFHPDDKQRAWDAWQRATQHNENYLLECRLRRADGVYRWWLIHGTPMRGANGAILKWFGTCTDIEEIKLAEEDLRACQGRRRGRQSSQGPLPGGS